MADQPERRQIPRLSCHLPVRLSAGDPNAPVIETLSKDLSSQGIRCLSPVAFAPQSQIALEIILGRGQQPIASLGTVVWCSPIAQTSHFSIGISLQSSKANQELIQAHIDRLRKKSAGSSPR